MSNLRRYYTPGQTYFVTIVSHERRPILAANAKLLTNAMNETIAEYKAKINVWVILPDHCHFIIQPIDNDLSEIVRKTKVRFAARLRSLEGKRNGRLWQNRFWDHIIRDQGDMNRHIDYIHYNPVKHGICLSPFEYRHSSASHYLLQGLYKSDWGVRESIRFEGEFGE